MSGFGGTQNYNNSNGRGRGRGRGRSSSSSGGRGRGRGSQQSGRGSAHPQPKLRPCGNWTKTGNCPHGNNCNFAHIVKLHASIDASNVLPSDGSNGNQYNNRYNTGPNLAEITSVAIWETQGLIKIFTGSEDGFWRLWNTQGGNFAKEFEHNMGGKVQCVKVASNHLFCGFEGISPALPDIGVGMVHAWNLTNPSDPPLEFYIHPTLTPYAHGTSVTQLLVLDGQTVVSGSHDGTIRLWMYDPTVVVAAAVTPSSAPTTPRKGGFVLTQTLYGHAREVTGLAAADKILWSCSTDGSIRVWDLENGACQHVITMATGSANPQQPGAAGQANGGAARGGVGHTNAVTSLLSFPSPNGTFILSSSLDGDIKAWNGSTGQCVMSESHGEGVVSMTLSTDASGNHQILLIGLESGNIMARNLVQTSKMPAFTLLFTLASHYTVGHNGAVRALCPGPASTFYSGGMDGKVLVFQFTGDLGL